MSSSEPVRGRTAVRCETHGLFYDAGDSRGCVLCRREAGAASPTGSAPLSSSGPDSGARAAWIAAGVLILLTAGTLFFAHDQAIQAFQQWSGGESAPWEEDFESLGLDPEDLESGDLDFLDYEGQDEELQDPESGVYESGDEGEGPIASRLQRLDRDLKQAQQQAQERAEDVEGYEKE